MHHALIRETRRTHGLLVVGVAALLAAAADGEPAPPADPAPIDMDAPIVLVDHRRGRVDEDVIGRVRKMGYEMREQSGELTEEAMTDVEIVLAVAGLSTKAYTEEELALIRTYLAGGGGMLLAGQSWSFVQYGENLSESDFSLNQLSEMTGIFLTQQYASYPRQLSEHSTMDGVDRVSWGKGVPSALRVKPPAVVLARDRREIPVMAAAELPAAEGDEPGRVVFVGHEWILKTSNADRGDNQRFLKNALAWLAPPARPLDPERTRELLAARGEVPWVGEDPNDKKLIWAVLNGALLRVNRVNGQVEPLREILQEKVDATSLAFTEGRIWVGTRKGLLAFDTQRGFWMRRPVNDDYDMLDVEVIGLEVKEEPARLVAHVRTGEGERWFMYDLETHTWGE